MIFNKDSKQQDLKKLKLPQTIELADKICEVLDDYPMDTVLTALMISLLSVVTQLAAGVGAKEERQEIIDICMVQLKEMLQQ